MAKVEFDPFSDDVIHGDKYALYHRLRDEAPACYVEKWDCWALSRFTDIWDACQNPAFSSARGATTAHLLTKVQPVIPMLNNMDPPEHSRLRAKIRAFFVPRRVRGLEPAIRQVVDELLDPLEERAEGDFVEDVAQPLAMAVGCMVIGLPSEDGAYLRDVVGRFFDRDPATAGMTEAGLAAMAEMLDYLTRISNARRGKAVDEPDPISVLHEWVGDSGQPLSDDEVAANLQLLLVGGTDTLPKVLANVLLRLGQNPDQRAEVAADPGLTLDAFNEAVRLDMPTQMMARSLLSDVEVAGEKLTEGQPVLLLYASGNRDEREFSRPDAYDLHRRPPRTLSFSHGTHACIGLHVARKEGEIALAEILRRFPEYSVDESGLERYATEFVQGYSRMPVRWRP